MFGKQHPLNLKYLNLKGGGEIPPPVIGTIIRNLSKTKKTCTLNNTENVNTTEVGQRKKNLTTPRNGPKPIENKHFSYFLKQWHDINSMLTFQMCPLLAGL